MKKIGVGFLSLALLVTGGIALSGNNSFVEKVHADEQMTIENVINKIQANEDITLTNDIIVTAPIDLTQITTVYTKEFDGNGYTISNLNFVNSASGYMGLIPQANGAIIKNLKLAGSLTFDTTNLPKGGGYIGSLLGYGKNVSIQTCEFDFNAINTMNVSQNLNYGVVAGYLEGDGAGFDVEDVSIDYSTSINFDKMINASIGGVAGKTKNASIVNVVNYGDMAYTGENIPVQDNINQYVGGIVGAMEGINAEVRNCCYGGTITGDDGYNNNALYVGTILGGCPSNYTANNVRYNYYTQLSSPFGDRKITSDKVQNITELQGGQVFASFDRDFMRQSDLFDGSLKAWDFETTWDYANQKVVLQRFEKFTFNILSGFEIKEGGVSALKDAYIELDEEQYHKNDGGVNVRYGDEVLLYMYLKDGENPNYQDNYPNVVGWFDSPSVYQRIDGVDVQVKNTDDMTAVPGSGVPNQDGEIFYGWYVAIEANASTEGDYRFSVKQRSYNCKIEVAEGQESFGGVRMQDATSGSTTSSMDVNFNFSNQTKQIVAQPSGTYGFKEWKVYHKFTGAEGEVDADNDGFNDNAYDGEWEDSIKPALEINFGTEPFTVGEFKLVASFDNDPAFVKFDFTNSHIDNITIYNTEFGEAYVEHGVPVVKKGVVTLKVTTKPGYKLNVKAFETYVLEKMQNVDSSVEELPETFTSDPIVDDQGKTTYTFNLNMTKLIQEGIEGGENIDLKIDTKKETSGASDKTWVWIILAVGVVVLAASIATPIVVVRSVRGKKGGKGPKSKTKSQEPKAESYKDYYV